MRLALLILALALPALAETPSLRSSAPLTLSGKDPLQRVALPYEAYRDARRDLADVRVVNGRGDSVPLAWAGEGERVKETPQLADLPVFPLMQRAGRRDVYVATEISVRTNDGTLVAIKPKGALKAEAPRHRAYVLDASKFEAPLQALVLEWKAVPGNEVVHVRVEASDDLKSWSMLASAPVVKLEAAGQTLSQPRVVFSPRKAKYLQLTWSGAEFALESARAELQSGVQAPTRALHLVTATPGPKAGEYLFDLGARLPVEGVRLVLAEPNSVVSATLYTREDEKAEWRAVTSAPFYRLQREGDEMQSPAVDIGRHAARYWMARLAAGSSTGAAPTLEASWRGAHVVFVAQGDGPFSIAFGNPTLTAAALPVATMIPNYQRLAELKLPEARAGPVTTGPPPTRWEKLVSETNFRRVALWAILLAGVALLGYMAWRLSKQVR